MCMALILNIDTALETASVSISKNGELLEVAFNKLQKDHGAFLQPAIQQLANKAGIPLNALDAIAVVAGPGSYTGLRVGMASAKGLCYALDKPLILLNTLEVMAQEAISEFDFTGYAEPPLFCAMVDARRMEVFTAIYDLEGKEVFAPCAMVIDENSFAQELLNNKIIFFGNGAPKCTPLLQSPSAQLASIYGNPLYISELSLKKYVKKEFSSLGYAEPIYIKEFYMGN